MLIALIFGCSDSEPPKPVEFYLVRHAEKDTSVKKDPPLLAAGEARALALAERLTDAGITTVHSTDTLRTRSTGAPTARVFEVKLQTYDGRKPEPILDELKETLGVHLVVGHSNTVPKLVAALGGEGGKPIDEEIEYNRLYHVVLGDPVKTELTTYGAPNPKMAPPKDFDFDWVPSVKEAIAKGNSIESPIGSFVPNPDGVMFRATPEFTAKVRNWKDEDPFATGLRHRWARISGLGLFHNQELFIEPAKDSLLKVEFVPNKGLIP